MSEKQTAGQNAVTGGISGLLAGTVATAVTQANPELLFWAPVIVGGGTAFLTGIGNRARTSGGWIKAFFGWF